jgi:GT2 family glycosyltransferase
MKTCFVLSGKVYTVHYKYKQSRDKLTRFYLYYRQKNNYYKSKKKNEGGKDKNMHLKLTRVVRSI